jgi:hypothetical protein
MALELRGGASRGTSAAGYYRDSGVIVMAAAYTTSGAYADVDP